mgnify:CR=1 FL=1
MNIIKNLKYSLYFYLIKRVLEINSNILYFFNLNISNNVFFFAIFLFILKFIKSSSAPNALAQNSRLWKRFSNLSNSSFGTNKFLTVY